MIILFIGSLAVGKTTICNTISNIFCAKKLSIDDFRQKTSNEQAYKKLIKQAILSNDDLIIEVTSASKYYQLLIENFKKAKKDFYIIKLICEYDENMKRFQDREKTYNLGFEPNFDLVYKRCKTNFAHLEINNTYLDIQQTIDIIATKIITNKLLKSTVFIKKKLPKLKPKTIQFSQMMEFFNNKLNDNKTFLIEYVSIKTGNKRIIQAQKNVNKQDFEKSSFIEVKERKFDFYNMFEQNSLILIRELGRKHPIAIKPFLILRFNDMIVKW